MKYLIFLFVLLLLFFGVQQYLVGQTDDQSSDSERIADILPPEGCVRSATLPNSFGEWLRNLPLRPDSCRIKLYNGTLKFYQDGLSRIVDLSVGDKDLQQCADVAIRLRSDFLLSRGRIDDIAFNFTSGDRASYSDWIAGVRPKVVGNEVTWRKTALVDSSFENYQKYLKTLFMYAGSYSLSQELKRVADVNKIKAGDCVIEGGFPGHVIVVVDVAIDTISGNKFVLFAQGFTPAQDIHIIKNLEESKLNPWYRVSDNQRLIIPEWIFQWSDLFTFE